MTQMDLLVTNVADLLATAVHEVLRLMGQAVSEYREESARMRQENQKLQRKMEELQKRLDVSDTVQQVSSSGSAEASSFEVHHQQMLGCRLEQEPMVSEEEHKHPESQNQSFKEEKTSEIQLEPEEQAVNTEWLSKPTSPTCNSSPKSKRPFSRQRKSTPASPNISAVLENGEFEMPRCTISNNVKMELNPEPPECVLAGQSDGFMPNDAVFNRMTLEDGQNQQPYSPGHSEHGYIVQEQYVLPHTNILSSRVDNMLDIPNPSRLNMRRESLHACHICGKTFATSSSLGAHFVCHSNERPFACKCCNFRFSRLADLKKHERIHTGERPYNCSLCGRRFNRTENLRRHLRKVHHGAML
ncbi:zinc finger protein 771 [Pygocentrus nattereri]|uniref:C2H2-type domain-containing protein n=1 Tax=Pygocentrus nattereri TaxID=42514 RepID=A0A3B4DYJ6_PYGNA|nr:zinc finger protein 771 [Pygocentrus nattereri]XP_017570988.1 zinc finger protein 771 [Pygocentrus nattereri]